MRFPITDNRQPPLTFPAIITPTTVASSNSRFRRWAALFLLLLSAAVYLGTASRPALLDDADASHALVSREMLQRGDYVVMFLNGVRYLQKAPIHYWLVALDYKIFGPTEFAVRLPVALAMIGRLAEGRKPAGPAGPQQGQEDHELEGAH